MSVLTVRFHDPSLADKDGIMSNQCTASSWTDVFADLDKANAEIARLKDLRQDQAQNYFKKWLASEEALEQLQMENSSLKYQSENASAVLNTMAAASETSSRLIKLISDQRDEALAENERMKRALHLYADYDDCWVDGAPDADNSAHDVSCGYCIAMGVLGRTEHEKALDQMVAESQRLGFYDGVIIRPLPVDPAVRAQSVNEENLFCECPEPIKVVYPGNDEVRRTVYCKKCLFDLKDKP